jgi:flagellar protein FlgJ
MKPVAVPPLLMPVITTPQVSASHKDTPEALHQAAQDFEALFIHMMMKAGREGLGEGGVVPRGDGEKFFADALDQELGRLAARQGGFGIARQLEAQWKGAVASDDKDPSPAP